MKGIQNFLARIASFSHRHPKRILASTLILTLLLGFAASKIRFNADLTDLLSPKFPIVQAVRRLNREISGGGFQFVIAHSPDPKANRRFLEALHKRLYQLKEIEIAMLDIPVDFFKDRALLFMDKKDLLTIERQLRARLKYENRKNNPLYIALDDEKEEPPQIPVDILKKKYGSKFKIRRHFSTEEGRLQGILIRPVGPPNAVEFSRYFVRLLKRTVRSLEPQKYHSKMEIIYKGNYTDTLREMDGIQSEIINSSTITAILLLLMLLLYFLRLRPLFFIGIPLAVAVIWTIGVTYLLIGYLNMITGFVGAILLGLGIDYGIHILSRYQHERLIGHDKAKAIEIATSQTGEATLIGALTTAATFLSLSFSRFRGFSEFGTVAGLGIVFCLTAMFTVLPALLELFDGGKVRPFLIFGWKSKESDGDFPYATPLFILSLALFVGALLALPHVKFEYRNSKIIYLPEGRAKFEKQERRFNKLFPHTMSPTVFVTEDERTSRALIAELAKRAQQKGARDIIGEILGVYRFVPPEQKAKLAIIGRIRKLFDDNDLLDMVDDNKRAEAKEFRRLLGVKAFGIADLPSEIRKLLISKNGRYLVYLLSRADLSDGRNAIKLKELTKGIVINGKSYVPASTSVIYALLLTTIFYDGFVSIIAAFILVFLIVFWSFRNIKETLLAIYPLLFGLGAMLGVMAIFDVRVSFMNVVTFPVLIGVGIDNGIHLIHRQREDPSLGLLAIWKQLVSPLILATLTSVIGFLGMLNSTHQGLAGVGNLASIGMMTTLFGSIIVLPATMQFLRDHRMRKEESAGSRSKEGAQPLRTLGKLASETRGDK